MNDTLVLKMLRLIGDQNNGILSSMTGTRADIREIKEKVGALETHYASLSNRLDRLSGEVGVIKRRLGLVEAS